MGSIFTYDDEDSYINLVDSVFRLFLGVSFFIVLSFVTNFESKVAIVIVFVTLLIWAFIGFFNWIDSFFNKKGYNDILYENEDLIDEICNLEKKLKEAKKKNV